MSAPFPIDNPEFDKDVRLGKYETGQQPCRNFKAHREGNGYAEWDNVHCCIYCKDNTVSWCENCHKDHHAGGYDTCERIGLGGAK